MSSSLPALHLAKTRLAAIQLGQIGSDKAFNLKHAREAVLKAASHGPLSGADMVMLPECFNSPYSVQQFRKYSETLPGVFEKVKNAGSAKTVDGEKSWGIDNKDNVHAIEPTQELLEASETVRMLSSVAKEAGVVLVGGSMPERDSDDHIYNTSLVFDKQGRIIAAHRKLHLFNVDFPGKMTFQESETLTPGTGITLFDCEFGRFGLGICYDMRFPEIAMVTGRLGAGAMLYPGAFNTTTGPLAWELLLRARATDNQIYTIGCSPARPTDGYPAWGHSTVVDPLGQVVATCAEEETIIWAQLDPERVKEVRKLVPVSIQRRFDAYKDVAK
ncbi:omega-amidase [Malassezia yamatoensis]|uniref:Omega-amidase n=1 Tax=Malassezia yamatoensis TaxID=253288 RepID=A0AAJ6CJY4_9BASI|nr:omega-amidase [Malassezia yamatoensis]